MGTGTAAGAAKSTGADQPAAPALHGLHGGDGWPSDIFTGCEEIDRDHRELLARVEAFDASGAGGLDRATFDGALADLGSYVTDHFGREDRLMRQSDYPYQEEHRAAHRALAEAFRQIELAVAAQGASLAAAAEVHRLLAEEIEPHIRVEDAALAAHLALSRQVATHGAAAQPRSLDEDGLAFGAAWRRLDAMEEPACLLDASLRIRHCNAAWDRFATAHGGGEGATGRALQGRPYLSCMEGTVELRRLERLLQRVLAGRPEREPSSCHGPDVARRLVVHYTPVPGAGGVIVGVAVSFLEVQAAPVAELLAPVGRDDRAFLDGLGRLERCSCCGRSRRRDRKVPTWEFVPAYLEPGAPWTVTVTCYDCFVQQLGLRRTSAA